MPTYAEITNAEIAPEQPLTTSLFTRLRDNTLAYAGAPTGTRAPWRQSSAPLGWTKLTDHNDKAFRVVSGSLVDGGTIDFSTCFSRQATDDFTLTRVKLPDINLAGSMIGSGTPSTAGVRLKAPNDNTTAALAAEAGGVTEYASANFNSADTMTIVSVTDASRTIPLGGVGSGQGHQHGMDIRTKFIDMIIAEKA